MADVGLSISGIPGPPFRATVSNDDDITWFYFTTTDPVITSCSFS
jgi:hypothetical protein